MEVTNEISGKRTPPVSLLTVSVPVQFQITNLVEWAYVNEDAEGLLEDLGTREVVRYLVGADMGELLSVGAGRRRHKGCETASRRPPIAHHLGAQIIAVGLADLHPPVKVAPEYEKVIAATQTKQARILAARADDSPHQRAGRGGGRHTDEPSQRGAPGARGGSAGPGGTLYQPDSRL